MLLADAELELVPPQIQGHASVRASAMKRGKSPSKILLDSSLHHPALSKVPEGERRGRPDIVHIFLLLCLDSILNLEGKLQTIVHTRNNEVIYISGETRFPKNYNRFVGLIEDLFEKKVVPSEEAPLLTLTSDTTLEDILEEVKSHPIAFSQEGKLVDLRSHFKKIKGDVVSILGGFPYGDFLSPVKELCDEVVSIDKSSLKVWTVASEILVSYRESLARGRKSNPKI